ncbi:hypothetical protein E2C01_057035 [Portunus trituberculatus]|uniref:Uncharacterized protein n=1 Tax=Portunus trituberculatus TaxID=210409 RepID=A0A5B7H287_PORTR|nr:hypothetical protein [Portunus trituberculatus]
MCGTGSSERLSTQEHRDDGSPSPTSVFTNKDRASHKSITQQ